MAETSETNTKKVGRVTYTEDIAAQDAGNQAVYMVSILKQTGVDEEGQYTQQEWLNGLQILKIEANRSSKLNTHPMENGQRVADNKVIEPTRITISAICDNKRGANDISEPSESADGESLISDIKNFGTWLDSTLLSGKKFSTYQEIVSLAKKVYNNLESMLTEKEFTTYSICTKGAVYRNMMLVGIEQLNDPEHLITIPVTLRFEECILTGMDSVTCDEEEDQVITLVGSLHEEGILPALGKDIGESFVNGAKYITGL